MTVIDVTDTCAHTHTQSHNPKTNTVQISACEQRLLSKNSKIWLLDNVTSVYLASTTSSSSGPFNECKRRSTHSQTAVSHQANTHCVHWNIQVTATISTANTTTGALHLQTLERFPDFLTWGGDVEKDMPILLLQMIPVRRSESRATLEDIV